MSAFRFSLLRLPSMQQEKAAGDELAAFFVVAIAVHAQECVDDMSGRGVIEASATETS
ncbi:hypothetical protein IEQ11_03685 [Lysobacter capsici]|uniref:hypothetical protein n=1 Tax=Lysobacter capsici TaxID=435897 RepID=UPI0017841501|nr:hypothetical protein [Lysobacter capsici]UOF15780.1 hypothetical protein IEQ11_03685 [Lysobacter capsici]